MINLIIPAAGKGRRFSNSVYKQFYSVSGYEILTLNLRKWLNFKYINKIYLLLPEDKFSENKARYESFDERIIAIKGGKTRTLSIYNAVKLLDEKNKYTFIHDGARPFFTLEVIELVLDALRENKAVIPALFVTDTLKTFKKDKILKTLDRSNYILIQTPQGFDTKLLKEVYLNSDLTKSYFDDSEMFEKLGHDVHFVKGEKNNIKITTAEDILFAEFLIKGKKIDLF